MEFDGIRTRSQVNRVQPVIQRFTRSHNTHPQLLNPLLQVKETVSRADLGGCSKYSYETYEDEVESGKRFQVNSLF
jgi:hypothetical protein